MKKILPCTLLVSVFALNAIALAPESGLKPGATVTPFHPTHVTGPKKGTDACPPCTYGPLPQVIVWVNGDDRANIERIARTLNAAAGRNKDLKAFVVVLTDDANRTATSRLIQDINARTNANHVHMAHLSRNDRGVRAYNINTTRDVKNTVILYKNRRVTDTFVNLNGEAGVRNLQAALTRLTS